MISFNYFSVRLLEAGRHSVRGHRLPSLYRTTILHENPVLQISSGVSGQTAPNGGDSRLMSAGVLRPRVSCGSVAERKKASFRHALGAR